MKPVTPYYSIILECKEVLANLVKLMIECSDIKLFKNIAAVYIVWQHHTHSLQLEELDWTTRN